MIQPNAMPAEHFDELARLEAGYWWHVGRVEWVLELIERWRRGRSELLHADLGCGTGGVATTIAGSLPVRTTWLVDSHPAALARLEPGPNRKIVCLDLGRSVVLPEPVDLITCLDVLEHIEDDGTLLRSIALNLRPGGLLVMTVPAHRTFFSDWDRVLGHFRRYELRELVKKVETAGLTVTTARPIWSFLAPAALLRKRRRRADGDAAEFPRVPAWMNTLLIALSRLERRMPAALALPFGTSLVLAAVKGNDAG